MAKRKDKKQPIYYTYLIGWTEINLWYYGVKYAQDADPALFWVKYFTTSKEVKKTRELYGEPNVTQIRRQGFKTPDHAVLWEHKVLRRLNVAKRPEWLNRHNGGGRFMTGGMIWVYDGEGNRLLRDRDDPQVISGELKPRPREEWYPVWLESTKEIRAQQEKEYREANKEEIQRANKRYREENRDVILAKSKERYVQSKEERKIKDKERYERDKEDRLRKQREKYHADKEASQAKSKAVYERRKTKANERSRARYQENRDSILARQSERREKKKAERLAATG